MYILRSIVNDVCNLDLNASYSINDSDELKDTLRGILIGLRLATGNKNLDMVSTWLTHDVTVHTVNIGDGRVYTLYEIREDEIREDSIK